MTSSRSQELDRLPMGSCGCANFLLVSKPIFLHVYAEHFVASLLKLCRSFVHNRNELLVRNFLDEEMP